MKIIVNSFLEALEAVKPGLGTGKSYVAGADQFIFDPDHVYSFNGEISVSYPFKTGIEGGVPAADLYAYLKKIKAAEVEITVDGGVLKITSSKSSKAGIVMIPETQPYDLGLGGDGEKTPLPEDFIDGLGFAQFSVAKDVSTGAMTCAYVKGAMILSCDNYRATLYAMKSEIEGDAFLIPLVAIKPLITHRPTAFWRSSDGGWLNFENQAGVVLSCRSSSDPYAADMVRGLFDGKGKKLPIPPEIGEAMERANIFSEEGSLGFSEVEVGISKTGDGMVRAEGPRGWSEEPIKADYKGKDAIEFTISPELFSNISQYAKEMELTDNLILFRTDRFQYLIARLRREEKSKDAK